MKFKEFLDKVEKEYFIDGEQIMSFGMMNLDILQLLNEDNMSLPERLVLEKVRARKS